MGQDRTLSVIIPVYFEEACIETCIREVVGVLERDGIDYEVVFVDDGSADRTVEKIKHAVTANPRLKLIELSYNHGKQAAVTAGIAHATGEYLLMMDPDLQDPPSEIPRFLAKIREGYDVVYGVRAEKRDSFGNVLASKVFWWMLNRFTGLDIPRGIAVMRIFNRRFANKFLEYQEASRFLEGMFFHVGMRQTTLVVEHQERREGETKFTFRKKMNLALNAMLDFSNIPLMITVRMGLMLVALGVLCAIGLIIAKLLFVDFQMGWPSVIVVLIVGFGLQIFFTGVVGTYVGKVYLETKRRPLFSIKELTNFP